MAILPTLWLSPREDSVHALPLPGQSASPRSRLGRKVQTKLSYEPGDPTPPGNDKEKGWQQPGRASQGDQNIAIMSQILLPETPANEESAGSPVSPAQTVYTSVKNTFQKKARKPEENPLPPLEKFLKTTLICFPKGV